MTLYCGIDPHYLFADEQIEIVISKPFFPSLFYVHLLVIATKKLSKQLI